MILRRKNEDSENESDDSLNETDSVNPDSSDSGSRTDDHVNVRPGSDLAYPNELGLPLTPIIGAAGAAYDFVRSGNMRRTAVALNAMRQGRISEAARAIGRTEEAALIDELSGSIGEAREAIKILKEGGDSIPPGFNGSGGSGGPPGMPSFSNSYMDITRLDVAVAPTEVRFFTGIKPNCTTPEDELYEADYAYTLHVNVGAFAFPDNPDKPAGNYFLNRIIPDVYNTLQYNLGFSIANDSFVTNANLANYFKILANALQVYYSIVRYLVYYNGEDPRNEALRFLRATISPSVADKLDQIRRRLVSLPIPPNLNVLCFWLMQLYDSGPIPGCPVLMFSAHSFTNGSPTYSELDTVLTQLSDVNFCRLGSYLGRAIPAWRAVNPYSASKSLLHDPQFSTVWANAPYRVNVTTPSAINVQGPSVSSLDTRLFYNSYTNNLDGGCYSLTSSWNTVYSDWDPGLLVAINATVPTGTSTRLSFITGTGFAASSSLDAASFSRDDTYSINWRFVNFVNTQLPVGAQRVALVTPRSIAETAKQMLDWLLSWDVVPSRVDKNLSGPPVVKIPSNPLRSDSTSRKPKQKKRIRSNKFKGNE